MIHSLIITINFFPPFSYFILKAFGLEKKNQLDFCFVLFSISLVILSSHNLFFSYVFMKKYIEGCLVVVVVVVAVDFVNCRHIYNT